MASYVNRLRARLPEGMQLYALLAVIAIAAVVVGCAAIFARSIVPGVRTWGALAAERDAAQAAAANAGAAQAKAPDALREKLAAAQANLASAAAFFASEGQAAEMPTRLYEYANECGVQVVNLQARPSQGAGDKFYELREISVRATGPLWGLLRFIDRASQASQAGCHLDGVSVTRGTPQHSLVMEVVLYTSPYAPDPPAPPAAGTPGMAPAGDVPQLERLLDAAWAAGDWRQAVTLIEQILALGPDEAMTEKLYAARVNWGVSLEESGDVGGASAQFQAALQVRPDGAEALAGLWRLLAASQPTTTPQQPHIIYTVREGDSLYSIALQYGTTVEAIMADNGLDSDIILPGQELYIRAE